MPLTGTPITPNKPIANRQGIDITLWPSGTTDFTTATPLLVIDYCNLTNISVTSDRVWATGGKFHKNKVAFDNSYTGTLKLSTQLFTLALATLMAGKDIAELGADGAVVFETKANSTATDYVITGTTVYKSEANEVFVQDMTVYKALPKRGITIENKGDGDPMSLDIEFDLMENDDGQILDFDFKHE